MIGQPMTQLVNAPAWMDDRRPSIGRAFAGVVWRHRFIYAAAFSTLALAVAVGALAGNMPDIGIVAEYGFYIACAFWIGGCGAAVLYLVWLGAVEREASPLKAFAKGVARFLSDSGRWANGVNGVVAFIVFAAGFSVLKGAITFFAPFSWDRAIEHGDRLVHLGRAPYEWLMPLVETPFAVSVFNFAYNLWFVVLLGAVFTAALTKRDTRLRHRFLLSFMLLWVFAGFFVAMAFSSAGPCYFERLGLGADYRPLTDALGVASQRYPVWALSTQDMLWSGYTGARNGSLGISAFPSLHVATSTLIALYAWNRSRIAGLLGAAFALAIMAGSVVLGWHYALDGYAGAFISVLIWKAMRPVVDRAMPELPA